MQQQNRRDFLKTTGLAGVGFWVGGTAAGQGRGANDQLNFACIGVGGKGSSDTADAAKNGNVVAICDVDDGTLARAAKTYPKAARYNDFRKMLDEMGKTIDAVTVSTPDHTHAAASAMAMNMGKHCFTQKPLTRTIYEARRLAEIAREKKVATQMGNQGTASGSLRRAAAIIRAGALGNVSEVHVWTDRPIWPQGMGRPQAAPVPKSLHWDLWLGPSPERPYAPGYHSFRWRGFWDFGTGALGDMACHNMNMPFMALDLRDPLAVQAETSGNNKESFPNWSIIRYTFGPGPNRAKNLTMVWYDGKKLPAADLVPGEKIGSNGVIVIGDKGRMYFNGSPRLIGVEAPDVKYPESPGHFTEWVRAIRGGPKAMSNFPDYAGALTETALLGNLAVWSGKRIEWDAAKLRATNAPEVESLIRPTYRKGYTL